MKMYQMFQSLVFLLILTVSPIANAKCIPVSPKAKECLTVPPQEIVKYAQKFSYTDFPKTIDILAIGRVESNFKVKAFNKEESKKNPKRKLPPSRGVMQVQGGSFDLSTNVMQGALRLRTYYLDECNRNIECTIKSYNAGPTGHKSGRAKDATADYWAKYNKRKQEYTDYYKKSGVKINKG
jgi:hypothetical protein